VSRLVVLGATGPSGAKALDAAARHGLDVGVIATRAPSEEFLRLADDHLAAELVVLGATPGEQSDLARRFEGRVLVGTAPLKAVASEPGSLVVDGLGGIEALAASVAALEAGNRVIVGDPATLAMSGPVLLEAERRSGGELMGSGPGWALGRSIASSGVGPPRRVVLVGDGGPLHGMPPEGLEAVSPSDVGTGRRTRSAVDRASLMDVAFAIVGLHLLSGAADVEFGVVADSNGAGFVETEDGEWLEHRWIGDPTEPPMTDPDAAAGRLEPIGSPPGVDEPMAVGGRCIAAASSAIRLGGSALPALGAADDVAVRAFLDGQIGFATIPEVVERTLEAVPVADLATVDAVHDAERTARELAMGLLGGRC
jgi:1-deoxy-D-xylulose-5-phosphate reductoisomerase